MSEKKQVDVRASFRMTSATPGHVTYGVWVNGGKSGELVVRQAERVGFEQMLERGGLVHHRPSGDVSQ